MDTVYTIAFLWDDEASVWVATSDDVPGLVLEHASFDALVDKVTLATPELLELNCGICGDIAINITISKCVRLAKSG